jgi:hypothetical protein
MTVQRLTKTPWYHYLLWHLGKDEWSFSVDGTEFRVINQWIGPTKLLQGEALLAERKGLFEVTGKEPFLTAKIRDRDSKEHTIAVYFQALLRVNVRIELDGKDISNGFV